MQDDRKALLLDLLSFRSTANLNTGPVLFRMLWNSATHDQIRIIKDRYERLSGYVSWANISKESVLLMASTGKAPKNVSDWNEGKFLLVLDAAVKKGFRLDIKALIEQLPKRKYILFLKRGFLYVIKPREGYRPVMKLRLAPPNDAGA